MGSQLRGAVCDVVALPEWERLFLKFQTSEAVPGHDPERVLGALEMCLRKTFEEVARDGNRVLVRGLGPSPRRVNLQDVTELSVKEMEGGSVIKADVSFRASAVIGDMPQNELVRSKLEGLFQQMKTQLDLEAMRTPVLAAALAGGRDSLSGGRESTAPLMKDARAETGTEALTPTETAAGEEESKGEVETPRQAEEVARSAEVPVLFGPTKPNPPKADIARPDVVEADIAKPVIAKIMTAKPDIAEAGVVRSSGMLGESPEAEIEEESGWSFGERLGTALAVLILVVLSAAGAYLFWGRYHSAVERQAAAIAQRKAADASRMAGASAGSRHMGSDLTDPKAWIEKWGEAMRSSDAAAQASFYAIPVYHYLSKWNVSRGELVKEKQAAINARKGLYTLRLEKVVVEKHTASDATVRLVKHSMVQVLPHKLSERWVMSRLQMKRIDGQWRITSERDILPD